MMIPGRNTGIRAVHAGLGFLRPTGRPTVATPKPANFRALTGYRRLIFGGSGRRHVWTPVRPLGRPSKIQGIGVSSEAFWNLLTGQGRRLQLLARVLLRLVTRQFEIQTAERIRRGLQLYSAYSRLWGEEAAKAWLNNIRRLLVTRGKQFLLSAVCISNYDWDINKISDECLKSAVRDLNSIEELLKATVQCDGCGKRQVIDQQMGSIDYCMCEGHLGYTNTSRVYDSWEPFIERAHHIVWRKKHEVHQHLYAYKVYGTYDDVSLSAFMEVQLNSDFRTEWDESALQLRVLDSEKESNSDLIYWRVEFPLPLADRDYIYKRRFSWDEEKQEAVILNEAVSLHNVPKEKGIHRVDEYWSSMVIRAKDDASKPGLEYTLTYFDNPGTSLPQRLTNFIAAKKFPRFLEKVHDAAVSLQAIHQEGNDVYVSLPEDLRYPTVPKIEKPSWKEPSDIEVVIEDSPEIIVPEELSEVVAPILVGSESEILGVNVVSEKSRGTSQCTIIEDNRPLSDHTVEKFREVTDLDEKMEGKEEISSKLLEEFIPSEEEFQLPCGPKASSKTVTAEEGNLCVWENEEVTSTGLTPDHEIFTESKEINANLDDDFTVPIIDKSLHVQHGNKMVDIDILEGMEVVAPDLDEQTALSKNVEKLTMKALEELENKTVLFERLKNIKRRLKLFKKYASEKKEISMKKMEEFKPHNRYETFDDQTQNHVQKLFDAMREVLQADKEMRTGKGLMSLSSVYVDKDEDNIEGELNDEEPYSSANFVQVETNGSHQECTPVNERKGLDSQSEHMSNAHSEREGSGTQSEKMFDAVDAKEGFNSQSEKISKVERDTSKKESKPSNDPPPPPPPPPLSASVGPANSVSQSESNEEEISNEIETYSGIDTFERGQQNFLSSYVNKSWFPIPYILGWWEAKESLENEDMSNIVVQEKGKIDINQSYVDSIGSQIWYLVGLGWIFSSNSDRHVEDKDLPVESLVSKCNSNSDKEEHCNWYWYPVSGAYRLYRWIFKSSKQSA